MGDGAMCHYCRRYNCICHEGATQMSDQPAEQMVRYMLEETTKEDAGKSGGDCVRAFVQFLAGRQCSGCKSGKELLVNSCGFYSHSKEGNYCNAHSIHKAYEDFADPSSAPPAASQQKGK